MPNLESKAPLLLNGKPVNSFSTNIPKEYPALDSANEIKEVEGNLATNAMTLVGSGVVVANMVANAGGMANAAADIAAAAAAAAASRAGEILGEYAAKFTALPLSIPTKIAESTKERINKTADDKDKLGAKYNPVKITLKEALDEFGSSVEERSVKINENITEDKKKNIVKCAQETLKHAQDGANKILSKSNEVIGSIMTHTLEGAAWLQTQIDNEIKRVDKNIRSELDRGYQRAESDINEYCAAEGEKLAVNIIEEYNKVIRAAAKEIFDTQNKLKSKANIVKNAAVQKAKLQIFALLGL
jgi:hypothetical protein